MSRKKRSQEPPQDSSPLAVPLSLEDTDEYFHTVGQLVGFLNPKLNEGVIQAGFADFGEYAKNFVKRSNLVTSLAELKTWGLLTVYVYASVKAFQIEKVLPSGSLPQKKRTKFVNHWMWKLLRHPGAFQGRPELLLAWIVHNIMADMAVFAFIGRIKQSNTAMDALRLLLVDHNDREAFTRLMREADKQTKNLKHPCDPEEAWYQKWETGTESEHLLSDSFWEALNKSNEKALKKGYEAMKEIDASHGVKVMVGMLARLIELEKSLPHLSYRVKLRFIEKLKKEGVQFEGSARNRKRPKPEMVSYEEEGVKREVGERLIEEMNQASQRAKTKKSVLEFLTELKKVKGPAIYKKVIEYYATHDCTKPQAAKAVGAHPKQGQRVFKWAYSKLKGRYRL